MRMLSLIVCLLLATGAASAGDKPNIIFIIADDLGARDLGCDGSSFYETPNLDRLAARGMRFTQAYAACPVCSPTRASVMTGKYPARVGITDYIPGALRGKLNPAPYLHELPLAEFTIAEALKAAGYATAAIGKWHLGGEGFYPDRQGFDLNVAGCEKGSPPSYFSPYKLPTMTDGPDGEYLTDRLTDEAVKFIEGVNRKQPFFLYLAHHAVHNPQQAKLALVAKYREKAAKLPPLTGPEFVPEGGRQARQVQNRPVYAAMLESLDEGVGRVVSTLERLRIAEQTVVFFTSDNGGLSTSEGSPTSNVPLRAGKGCLYEGGIRVPLIVSWPGVVKPSNVCDQPMTSTDYYPTMLEIAGLPLRPERHIDGVSLVSLLKGGTRPDRPLFWHYPHYGNQGGQPGGAVRMGDYKLIEWYESGRTELYDLRNDPSEKHDLAAVAVDVQRDLSRRLRDWRTSVNAKMPTPNPEYQPPAPKQ